jgi:CRP-like cAMP-binding protein
MRAVGTRARGGKTRRVAVFPNAKISRGVADSFLRWFGEGPRKKFADAEYLFRKGEPARHAYVLESGAIEILQDDPNGSALVVKILAAPNLFGVIEVLGGEARYLETVRALGDSSVLALSRQAFVSLLRRSGEASFACLINTACAFCLSARFEPTHLASSEQKLANYMASLFDLWGERLPFKRGQDDFASATGISERNVNRLLTRLQTDGIVRKHEGRYELLDGARLRALAGELYGSLVFRQTEITP